MSANIKTNQSGFTLVELNISILMIGIISATLLTLYSSFLVIIVRTNALVEMTSDSQNMLRSMVEQLRYGAGVRSTNSINDPNAPGGAWSTSNASFVIIIATPAVNSSGGYIIDTATGEPYLNELVYYKSGKTLLKRTLAHPSASGNTLRTTCPPASATASCTADAVQAENINTVSFTLYDQDDLLTNDPLLARSITINTNLSKITLGNTIGIENKIRITLRNTF